MEKVSFNDEDSVIDTREPLSAEPYPRSQDAANEDEHRTLPQKHAVESVQNHGYDD